MARRHFATHASKISNAISLSMLLVLVMRRTFAENHLVDAFCKGDEPEFGADAPARSGNLVVIGRFAGHLAQFAKVREPLAKDMVDFFQDHSFDRLEVTAFDRLFCRRNHWPVVNPSSHVI